MHDVVLGVVTSCPYPRSRPCTVSPPSRPWSPTSWPPYALDFSLGTRWALAHEPLPWVREREPGRDKLVLRLRLQDGRTRHGPATDPYRTDAYVGEVRLDGVPHGTGYATELGHSVASLAPARAEQDEDRAAPADQPGGWPRHEWEAEQ